MSLQSTYNAFRGYADKMREHFGALSTTSTFRQTGELTPEEFVRAGDYLVYKFPSWGWAPAASPARAVAHLPPDKQFLVTRGVPCRRRLNEKFAGDGEEHVVRGGSDEEGDGEEGWLSTGGVGREERERMGDVRVVGEKGEADEAMGGDDEDEIPDMEDEDDDEAIIREPDDKSGAPALRTYTLYITYSRYYHTPRLYLSGYLANSSQPLPPKLMLEDIMGDYKDKTVTLEEFPFFDAPVQMASVHPCRHAAVMKLMLDRADAALRLRKERARKAAGGGGESAAARKEVEGLVEGTKGLSLGAKAGAGNGGASGDEWEVLQQGNGADDEDDEYAIRVDQYIVVFLKFIASVTPGMEHDFTMGI